MSCHSFSHLRYIQLFEKTSFVSPRPLPPCERDEEENRRMKQKIESNEKKRRELEEEMEKSNKPDVIHRRGSSYSRRNLGKSTPSNLTPAWLGTQKIPERD